MQTKHESILRAINNNSKKYNIFTFPTHESFQSNWASMPHTFYLYQGEGIKPWTPKYRPLPKNHILLNGSAQQVLPDMKFDLVLCQGKHQYNISKSVADYLNINLICLEHTLPQTGISKKHLQYLKTNLVASANVFISEYSCKQWLYSPDENTFIIEHGIDTNLFSNQNASHDDGKILTVMNDAINRTWCLGTDIYFRITKDLPTNPVGDSPGLSIGAKDTNDLIDKYKNASVFLNTSTVSPLPMSLIEAAACGCPIVTTSTCAIPEYFQDEYNCFMSNDESYLRDKLIWCLENKENARELGLNARKTIEKQFNLQKHTDAWCYLFDKFYGKGIKI